MSAYQYDQIRSAVLLQMYSSDFVRQLWAMAFLKKDQLILFGHTDTALFFQLFILKSKSTSFFSPGPMLFGEKLDFDFQF